MSKETTFDTKSPVLLTLDGAWMIFEPPLAPVVDKARVLAHLRQQMTENGIAIQPEGGEHGDA